jgi:mono/diheme cytochrome c family protein
VLAVLLFAAFWVVLGLGVFFLGIRGGPRAAADSVTPQPGSYRARRALGWTFVIVYIAFGILIPALFLIGNKNRASAQVGGIKLTQADRHGRELFGLRCGQCHTLAAANAVGKVGPNLDVIQPSYQLTLHTIQNGCVQNPPPGSQQGCLGYGTMPADVVQGTDAQDVSRFVAKVAGKE